MNRRSFLKTVGILAGTCLAKDIMPDKLFAAENNPDNYLGYLYDSVRCVGCEECTFACVRTNVLPGVPHKGNRGRKPLPGFLKKHSDHHEHENFGFPMDKPDSPDIFGERTLTDIIPFDNDRKVKHACMHCLKPSCVSACPVKAMIKDPETGIVYNNPSRCIGCRYCMVACPFNAIKYEWNKTIPNARVVKCNLCMNTKLKAHGITACSEACPFDAIKFGKRAELLKIARNRINDEPDIYNKKIFGEKDGGGTSVLILAGTEFANLGLPDLGEKSPAEYSEFVQGVNRLITAALFIIGAASLLNSKILKNKTGFNLK